MFGPVAGKQIGDDIGFADEDRVHPFADDGTACVSSTNARLGQAELLPRRLRGRTEGKPVNRLDGRLCRHRRHLGIEKLAEFEAQPRRLAPSCQSLADRLARPLPNGCNAKRARERLAYAADETRWTTSADPRGISGIRPAPRLPGPSGPPKGTIFALLDASERAGMHLTGLRDEPRRRRFPALLRPPRGSTSMVRRSVATSSPTGRNAKGMSVDDAARWLALIL